MKIDLVMIDAIKSIAESLEEKSVITHSLTQEIELAKDFWGRPKKGSAIKKKILTIVITEQI